MAVGTRTGEVHLWSTISICKPASLKSFCRMRINSYSSAQRKQMVHLPISKYLINYLLYKNSKVK
jgi:hypothetical protein